MNAPAKVKRPRSPDYWRDGYGWALAQAQLLHTRNFSEIDWENVIEEIESMGRSERNRYQSHLAQVMIHMLKWDAQPKRRGKSWWLSIANNRVDALHTLKENPSLKPELARLHSEALAQARKKAALETGIPEAVFDAIEISQTDAFEREFTRPEGDD